MTQKYSAEGPDEDTQTESPEAKLQAEEFRRELNAWKQNPMTRQVAAGLQHQADIALRNLISSGQGSTDPNVCRYAAQYVALTSLIKNLKEQPDAV
jgi:hypothetical protein